MHKMAAAVYHTRCNPDGEAPLFNPRRGLDGRSSLTVAWFRVLPVIGQALYPPD